MKCSKALVQILLILLQCSALAHAASNCSANVSPLNFPPYDMFDGAPSQSQTEIAINCDTDLPYVVKIGPGQNALGDFSRRQLLSGDGGNPLFYNLFLDSSYSRIWGDGNGFSEFYSGVGLGRPEILRVFGRIPVSQNIRPGLYTDSVIITIEW
ncbi:MAG: spore coat U domain-containing protein [Gammaproteobacteria bacterium]|nr:spore coat U domain-containing protein [Gammaproteobacteria bacterium]